MQFVPPNPEFAVRVRDSFTRQAAIRLIGARLAEIAPGRCSIELPVRADLTQQHGFQHAGVVATGLDTACGYAAFTLMSADAGVLTIEFKVNLLAPARGPRLTFEGAVTKPGRTISVVDGRAWESAAGGNERKLVATMTATVMTITGRADVRH